MFSFYSAFIRVESVGRQMLEGQCLKMDSLHIIGGCSVTTIWALTDWRLVEEEWKYSRKEEQTGKLNTDAAT